MRAGIAKGFITPPLPVQLAGYGIERVCTEVADELAARALVVEQDGRRVALLSAELLWLERRHVRVIRDHVARLCGLAPDDVMVSVIHTHAGPDTLDWYDFAPVEPAWLGTLLRQLAGLVWLACQRLRPVRAELTFGHLPIGINRRQFGPNGCFIGEDPERPYDERATGLRLLDDDGRLYASVVCGTAHPVSLGSAEALVSGDWPGLMCRMVESTLGGTCLFVNGACGDINPQMWGVRGYQTMQRIGHRAGGAAIELLSQATVREAEGVGAARRELTVPHRDHPYLSIPLKRRLAEDGAVITEVQALRLGPLHLISQPGECLTETGWRIQRETKLADAVIAGYTNDYVGYLPLPHIYDEGGYEPGATMLPADSVLAVVAAAVEVGDALAGA
ncbi:MAG: hypothetical protein HZB16_06910 [Armatimonadetes bacterium]|nr:hypothetical protein [Armatimonadota bacterium]